MTVTMRGGAAVLVELDGHERLLEGLRRRGLIIDSPRFSSGAPQVSLRDHRRSGSGREAAVKALSALLPLRWGGRFC